jgi:hypothetical protein
MAQSKFMHHTYIKLADSSWRYCRAAFYSNGKIKPNRCVANGKEEEHPEGAYLYHRKNWIPVGADALEAHRRRNARLDDDEFKRLQGTAPVQSPTAAARPCWARCVRLTLRRAWASRSLSTMLLGRYRWLQAGSEQRVAACPCALQQRSRMCRWLERRPSWRGRRWHAGFLRRSAPCPRQPSHGGSCRHARQIEYSP